MMAAWDMHQIIGAVDDYPESVIVHRHGVRESGRRYVPEATESDFSLRKAVEGLEGQISALQAENDALRADNGRYNVAGAVMAHIVDESTLDVQGVRFVRAGAFDVR